MDKNMKRRILMALSMLIIILAAAAALGVDDYDDEPAVEGDEDTGLVESYDVVRTAQDYGTLSTFVTMLQDSDVAELLNGEGPYTVFIPDDSAFKAVDAKWLKKVLADKKELKKLLSRHIVADAAITFGRDDTLNVVAMSGDTLHITADEEKVKVNNAEVLDEEIECSNGIIHVIDAVLKNP